MFYKTQCVVPKRITRGQFHNLFSSSLTSYLYLVCFRISHLNVQCQERDVNNVNRPQLHIYSVCNSCCSLQYIVYYHWKTIQYPFGLSSCRQASSPREVDEVLVWYKISTVRWTSSMSLRMWTQGKSYSWGLAKHLELTFCNLMGKHWRTISFLSSWQHFSLSSRVNTLCQQRPLEVSCKVTLQTN